MSPVGWEALERWGDDVTRIEPLSGGVANDVWSVRVNGRRAVGRLGARSDADLAWETGLLQHLDRAGLTVPVPIPTTDGRLFADGLVVMTYLDGGPPETPADWRRVAGTLRELHRLVVPGGNAVVGEGFWKKPTPDREYLEFLGASADDLTSHRGNQALIEQAGWELLRAWATSDAEWDAYEESYRDGIERHALDQPGHADVPAMLVRIRAWHHAYQFFGRFNLGFGLYLLRRR
jgi:hypothetical protein